MSTRRDFLKTTAAAGAGTALYGAFGGQKAQAFYQSSGLGITAFTNQMRNVYPIDPGGIPVAVPDGTPAPVTGVTHYTINCNQYQDTLHPALGPTTLWGYHSVNNLGGAVPQRHLGAIIVAQKGVPVQLTVKNNLPAAPIIPADRSPFFPDSSVSVNRIAVHLHGGLIPWISDGGPYDWYGSTVTGGGAGPSFINNAVLNPGAPTSQGEYYYGNNQSARLMWYHDHAHDVTRTNAYSGIATAYIIRDNYESNLRNLGLPDLLENGGNEIPLVVQDKIFVNGATIGTLDPTWVAQGLPSTTGSLWYPHFYDPARWAVGPGGLPIPDPSCIPEMYGDTMLVNGTVCPTATVQARRYRIRLLNACNARFLNLQMYVATPGDPNGITLNLSTGRPYNAAFVNAATGTPHFMVIGTEGGFTPYPVLVPSNMGNSGSLLVGTAERFDIIVDFKNYAGQEIVLYNDAAAPYPVGDPANDYFPRWNVRYNPVNGRTAPGQMPNTRVLMKFKVVPATGPADLPLAMTGNTGGLFGTNLSAGNDPLFYKNPAVSGGVLNLPAGVPVRQLTLNEDFDDWGRLIQKVGTNVSLYPGTFGRYLVDSPTEVLANGQTEVWQFANLTGDVHPMHFHLVNVQVLARQNFDPLTYNGTPTYTAPPIQPMPTERGWKETVKMYPGTVTTFIAKFDMPKTPFAVPPSPRMQVAGIPDGNEYVYHCHILEHEEHDMMRPMVVTGAAPSGVTAWPKEPAVPLAGGTVTVNLVGGTAPYAVTAPAGFTGTAIVAGNILTITIPAGAAGKFVFTVTTAVAGDTETVTVVRQ